MDIFSEVGEDAGSWESQDDTYGALPILPQRGLAPGEREARVREEAYRIAARRGFAPGRELDDWLEAERAVDAGLA